jgi:hypothetical protein
MSTIRLLASWLGLACALALLTLGGCARKSARSAGALSHHASPERGGPCAELALWCHGPDTNDVVARECHLMGHTHGIEGAGHAPDAECTARRESCFEACVLDRSGGSSRTH